MRLPHSDRDMTHGIVWKQLLLFSVPILLGELFQQLYNTVDSVIVGRFVGKEALAAVGSTGNLTKLLIGFFLGISIGCTVVAARHYGAGDRKGLKDAINVIMFLSIILGILLSVIGVLITAPILRLMNTPDDVFPLAVQYIRIFFAGLSGFVLYNTATGILRAVGDSRHPLYFLLFSSALNIVLDCLFVIVFHMGVAGVALATILSQFISAFLCIRMLIRTTEVFKWEVDRHFYRPELIEEIFRIGLPTGVQRTLTQVSNIILLSYIAVYGSACLAGWAIYIKIQSFLLITSQSIGSSAMTFVSQNLGAKNAPRIRKGIRISLGFAQLINLVMMIFSVSFAGPIASIFGSDPEMLQFAVSFIRYMLPFSILQCCSAVSSACLRGLGQAMTTTAIMMFAFIPVRQVYLLIAARYFPSPVSAGLAYPVGWFCASFMFILMYFRLSRDDFGIVRTEE